MTKPEDVEKAIAHLAQAVALPRTFFNYTDTPEAISTLLASHAALVEEVAHWKAEHGMLQDILDTRPAINAGLPDSYIRWSQGVMSGDFARALLSGRATS